MGVVARQGIKTSVILYLGVLLGALNTIWVYPKFLAPGEIGTLRLLLASELIFAVFVRLGTTSIVDRFFPTFKDNPQKKGAFIQFCLLYPLVGLAVFFAAYLLFPDAWLYFYKERSPTIVKYYYILALLVFLITYQYVLMAFARAYYRIVIPNILDNFFLKFSISIMALLLGFQIINFDQFIKGIVLVRVFNVIVLAIYFHQLIPEKIQWGHFLTKREIKEIIQFGLYVVLGGASAIIISQVDTLMISSIIGETATGIYTTAFFMGTVVEMPRRALAQISLPVIASAWKNNDFQTIQRIYQKTSLNQLIVGAWVLLLILVNIGDLFTLMPKGYIYRQGYYVAVIIGITRFIDMAMGANNEILLHSKYYKFNLLFNVILALLMVGINLVLIPVYKLNGAAIATLSSIIIFNLIRFIFLWWKYKIQPFSPQTLLTLLVGGIAILGVYLISFLSIPTLLNIAIKSLIISLTFAAGIWYLKLSEDITQLAQKVITLIKKRR